MLDGKSILYVEDDQMVRESVERAFALHCPAAKVTVVGTLDEAMDELEAMEVEEGESFDAVLTDWHLGGKKTAEDIVYACDDLDLPFLVLSADSSLDSGDSILEPHEVMCKGTDTMESVFRRLQDLIETHD